MLNLLFWYSQSRGVHSPLLSQLCILHIPPPISTKFINFLYLFSQNFHIPPILVHFTCFALFTSFDSNILTMLHLRIKLYSASEELLPKRRYINWRLRLRLDASVSIWISSEQHWLYRVYRKGRRLFRCRMSTPEDVSSDPIYGSRSWT